MRVTWEEKDIRAGLRYGTPTIRERWIIGYTASSGQDKQWVSVSLTDGMVTPPCSAHELAIALTEAGYMPEALLPSNS